MKLIPSFCTKGIFPKFLFFLFHSLSDNRKVLVGRLDRVREEHNRCENQLEILKRESVILERKSNSLKLEVLQLAKQMDQYKNVLLSRGLSAEIEQSEASQAPQPVSIFSDYC